MNDNKPSQADQYRPEKSAEDPGEETIDEPVMDGATETFDGDEDPRKGTADPALIRRPKEGDKTLKPYD